MKSLIPHDLDDFSEEEQRDYTWLVQQQAMGKLVPHAALRKMSRKVLDAAIGMYDQVIENDKTGDKNE